MEPGSLPYDPTPPRHPCDEAVSPVVGMILVLAISTVGIAAIVYYGLPAIDEMKANVEFKSAEAQFQELDGTMKELVAGTTQRTAKRWSPSIARGEITVGNGTEAWLYQTEPYNASAHDWQYGNLVDGDHILAIRNNGVAAASVKVEAYIVTGGASETTVNVTHVLANAPVQMGADIATWPVGDTKYFYLYKNGVTPATTQSLDGAVFKFRIYTGQDLVSEAWYMETGAVTFRLDAGMGTKEVVVNNGAVITGSGNGYAIVNSPSIPAPVKTAGVDRTFARAIVIQGHASFAGADRFDALLSLYATATLASYDCAEQDRSDCVLSSKIAVFGSHRAPWYAYLTNANRGYAYTEESATFPAGAPGYAETYAYLEDRRAYMAYTFIESVIDVKG